MKILFTCLAILAFGTAVLAAEPSQEASLTGRDWPKLSSEMKSATVLVAAKKLQALGVPLEHKLAHYLNAIDWMLLYEPDCVERSIGDILADYLYENEVSARSALEGLLPAETSS